MRYLALLAFSLLGTTGALAACGSDADPAIEASEAGADGTSSGGAAASSGSGASSSGSTPPPPIPKDRFLEEFAKATCTNVGPCCANAGYDTVPGQCEQSLLGAPDQAGALDNPNVTYDGQAAADCVQLLAQLSSVCTVPSSAEPWRLAAQLQGQIDYDAAALLDNPCQRIFTGNKPLGAQCVTGECAQVTVPGEAVVVFCAPPDDGPDDAPTICQATTFVTQEGASCTDPSETNSALGQRICYGPLDVIDTIPTSAAEAKTQQENFLTCYEGACTPIGQILARLGTACGYHDACELDTDCKDGTCVAAAAVNASCASVSCVHGAYCDDDSRICLPERADGEPCERSECLGECNDFGRCAAPDGVANEQRCVGTGDAG